MAIRFTLLLTIMIVALANFAYASSPTLSNCAIFPADNVWNTAIDTMPVDSSSATYIATIGASGKLHPDFGAGLYDGAPMGIPYTLVPGSQPTVPMVFAYVEDSDPGPYPFPADAAIEGGSASTGDRHVLVLDKDNCNLYETWDSHPQPDGSWQAGSGAIFDLKTNNLRPAGWTSADAAGLPVLAGLLRYDEVAAGEIGHALRFTVPVTRKSYVWPARHYASSQTETNYPPLGQRFRLKASFDISGFSTEMQVILTALKKYGMILADNGSAWYISGVPDDRWNNDALVTGFSQILGSDFEAIDESGIMVNADSGQAIQPNTTNYYVSTSGNDANSGTIAAPWRTIQHAANVATPGSIVNVRAGVYNEIVRVGVSGTVSDGYITFQNYPGEVAILDGSTPSILSAGGDDCGLINVESRSYVIIKGFELRNFSTSKTTESPAGILVRGSGSSIKLLNNNIHNITTTAPDTPAKMSSSAFGIAVKGTGLVAPLKNIVIDGNDVHHLKTGASESVTVNGNVNGFTVSNNRVHDNNNIGIDCIGYEGVNGSPDGAGNSDPNDAARNGVVAGNSVYNISSYGNPAYGNEYAADGIYVDGGNNIVIERNDVHDNDINIEIASEWAGNSSSYVTVRNNLVYNGLACGISIGGYASSVGGTDHCDIVNNTLYNNDTTNQGGGEFQIQYYATNNRFMNNIVYANSNQLFLNPVTGSSSDVTIDYNLFYSPTGGSGSGTNAIFADPQFLNTAIPDFRLNATSPAVGAGTDLGVAVEGTTDFAGNARMSNGIDLGAFALFTSSASPVNGSCGSDNGKTVATTPTNLCLSGIVANLTGTTSFTWDCLGQYAGTTDHCSAQLGTTYGSGQILFHSNASYTNSTAVTLDLAYYPAAQHANNLMQFFYDNKAWTKPEPYATSKHITLPKGDGVKIVTVRFIDDHGDVAEYSAAIILDTIAPVGGVSIDQGAVKTNEFTLHLKLFATDINGVTHMKFSETGKWLGDEKEETFGTTFDYLLSDQANGTKKIFVQFKDASGKWSPVYSDSVYLNDTWKNPDVTGENITIKSARLTDPAGYTTALPVQLTISNIDPSWQYMSFSTDGVKWSAWEPAEATKSLNLPGGDGYKTVYARFALTNSKTATPASIYSGAITLDTKAPVGSIRINDGAIVTNDLSEVRLALDASDMNGVVGMYVNYGQASVVYETFSSSKIITDMPSGEGAKKITVIYVDSAGLKSKPCTASIVYDHTSPKGTLKAAMIKGATSPNVVLSFSASGAVYMQCSLDDGKSWGDWEPYAASKKVTLTTGDQTVEARFRDLAGNVSDVATANITIK